MFGAQKKVFLSLQERIWMGTLRVGERIFMLSKMFSLAINLVLLPIKSALSKTGKCDLILSLHSVVCHN